MKPVKQNVRATTNKTKLGDTNLSDQSKLQLERLKEESNYIRKVFSYIPFPRTTDDEPDSNAEDDESEEATQELVSAGASHWETKLASMKYRHLDFQGRKARSKLKRKLKQASANNEEGATANLAFSKLDFSATRVVDQGRPKKGANPKILLQRVKRDREKMTEGDRVKKSWDSALGRAQGQKIKDDPILLKKAVQTMERKKRVAARKWEGRIKAEQKKKEQNEQKRRTNIQQKKGDKKKKKMKLLRKKGRIVD